MNEFDRYIEKAQPFARPILERIRRAMHEASAEISEAMKWSHPAFLYKDGIFAGLAAFKQHVSWGFWDDRGRGKVEDVSELPPHDELVAQIRAAIARRDAGVKPSRAPRKAPAPLPDVPPDFAAALKKNATARKTFDAFPPSHRREYLDWITEAKQEATRAKRIAQAIEWLSEGKPRNWKYMKK
jgi:Bacteriocin-protection, YdeI or OmpD-Associated/Domain of unknown function (DU1801)